MTDYSVVLLVEQELSERDAAQVRSLHEAIEDPVRYHVLLPVEDASIRVESAMGALGAGEMMPTAPVVDLGDVQQVQQELLAGARAALSSTVAALEKAGAKVVGELLHEDPVTGLTAKVAEVAASEAIILTRPHVVAEFFHLDWTSRARRKLGVPVLHLLERETFDEQAGQGEGVTGL